MNKLSHKVSEKYTFPLQLCRIEIKTITQSLIFFQIKNSSYQKAAKLANSFCWSAEEDLSAMKN